MLAAPYLFAYLGFKNPSNIKTSCFKNLECWDSKTFRFLYWDLKTIASQSTIFLLKNDTSIQWISSISLWDLKTKLLGSKNPMLGFKNLMLGFKNRCIVFTL
ncbi:hypothetical protein ACUTFT_22325 [Citrobacter freundii]|uniref:hypothetical protein n=1 Tax=Enterobacteriaceae TaxID=543 RepID=UPI001E65A1A9|nr:hypothetical protein [Escherichia coli]HBW8875615.1 hypothetical protein [Klebsiella quasipneumoniae subsp. similipneumoniae]HCR3999116.1 hypothetical protein [Citrobacter freundii]